MQVILKQDVEKLGLAGDIVDVKPGYGRNFLLPRGMAILATPGARKAVEAQLQRILDQRKLNLDQAHQTAAKLEGTTVTIAAKAGEQGRIFGSVTNVQIAEALKEKGLDVDRRKIQIGEDVRQLGEHKAQITLHEDVKAELTFWVVKDEE
jgi:large subunit ribosomal protein L9